MATASFTGMRPMPRWLKLGLLGALVFGVCWAGAIAYWRVAGIVPGITEVAVLLLGMPVLLVLGGWAGAGLMARRASAGAPGATAAAPAVAGAGEKGVPLAILAAALRSPHGASAEELVEAIASGKARADLDPELVDEDGFPVMTARCDDARDEALREEIAEWLAGNGMPDLRFSDEQWRALTLGTAVVMDLASQAATELIPADGEPPVLLLAPISPRGWNVEQRHAAGMWFKHLVVQVGWPVERIQMVGGVERETHELPIPSIFDRLAAEAAAPSARVAAIVVACASHIEEATVSEWDAKGILFTSSRPHGVIPGEGAAGLLVTDIAQAKAIEGAVFTLLYPMEEARRDSSADESRRVDAKLLDELTGRVLRRAGADYPEVALIVADTGHRSSRTFELMKHQAALMPQLEAADDVVRAGEACGSCGAVPFIVGLALARHFVSSGKPQALVISNEDAFQRIATLVRASSPQS